MIIYINGRGMNAPELKAYISELEAENEELRAKVESANRQIAEYKRLLKAAVEDMTIKQFGRECMVCSKNLLPNECPIHNNVACIFEKDFKWRYADEALALIGEEGDAE